MRRVFIAAMSTAIVLTLLTWRAAHTLYFSPGTHAILRQDSNTGAATGFLVVLATAIGCLTALVLRENGKPEQAKVAFRISLGGFAAYTAAVIAVSLATPRMIVTGGDSYCYDLWCIAVQKVTATPAGQNTLYTIQVRLSSDANRVKTSAGNALPYLLDDQGHRFSLAQDPSVTPMDTTLSPGESVTTSVTFTASPKTHRLYLTRDYPVLPWVPLYFASDISLFHRRTLLRAL
jgi:hypothetical protein